MHNKPKSNNYSELAIVYVADMWLSLIHIFMGIATEQLKVGETLPSVRQLADTIGINMHTVNKAYSVVRQEGFLSIDRRRGAVISIDVDKIRALEEMKENPVSYTHLV